jgi:bifunctional non-homologous end joining protein LigD
MLRGAVRPNEVIAVPDWVSRDGVAFFEAAREHGLLGIVAKESDSRYLPGQRSPSWLSVRVFPRDEFVIVGYTFGARWDPRDPGRRSREPFSSLLLALYGNDGSLSYVGEVAGGFDEDEMYTLLRAIDEVAAPFCPLTKQPDAGRLVFWCRPELVATIRYAGWTADGKLRFPVFDALRLDVPAESCVIRRAE